MGTLIDLFTGTSKWLYIALLVCGVALIGASALSISLFADKTALHVSLTAKEAEIGTLKKEHKKAIEEKDEEIKKLGNALAQCNADKQTQNALIEQNRIDMATKENEFKEAMAKKPKIVTDIKYIPKGDDECNDLKALIDEYISTGAQQ